MKVFVLIMTGKEDCYYGDGWYSLVHFYKGVYSTREKAEEAAKGLFLNYPLREDGTGYEILEEEVQ